MCFQATSCVITGVDQGRRQNIERGSFSQKPRIFMVNFKSFSQNGVRLYTLTPLWMQDPGNEGMPGTSHLNFNFV
jgi:hypothetical protein